MTTGIGLALAASQPATGESAEQVWLNDKMSTFPAQGKPHLVLKYNRPRLGKVLELTSLGSAYVSVTDSGMAIGLSPVTALYVTDPDADVRLRESRLLSWSQSLANLETVANLIIPTLRDLTLAEQDGLTQYRRKLFRKV